MLRFRRQVRRFEKNYKPLYLIVMEVFIPMYISILRTLFIYIYILCMAVTKG